MALKPKEKKSKIKENIEILTARQTSTNGGLGRLNVEDIQENIERYDLTSRGAQTTRRLYEQSKPFTVRDVDLYI